MRRLSIAVERFAIAGAFVIARGAKTEAVTIVATIEDDGLRGRGECVPYARYGESCDSVIAAIETVRAAIESGIDRFELQSLLPAGAARNALDCALWDLDAKIAGVPAYRLAGLDRLPIVTTAFTLSVDTPEAMAAAAERARDRPLLKIKLAGEGDIERLAAVRAAAPRAELIVDANESWRGEDLEKNLEACVDAGVRLLEQPLPAADDMVLAAIAHKIAICADESVHDRANLAALRNRYDAINIKLDKTGGLTEALALLAEAEALGFAVMVGCMVSSSLAMTPALILAAKARFVDLDGPLLLARDRSEGLIYEGSLIRPPDSQLWG